LTTEVRDITDEIRARDGVAVVVYTKSQCSQCAMTKRLLDRESIHYTTVNVEEDPTAYWYVTERLNLRQMPVVVTSEEDERGEYIKWSGFQPQKIRQHITNREAA
jgi:glutaredoxin-like protein NrdH